LEKITKAGGKALNLKGEAFETPKPKAVFVPREKPKKKVEEEAPATEGKKAEGKKSEETKAE
jgi:hypothetical protein